MGKPSPTNQEMPATIASTANTRVSHGVQRTGTRGGFGGAGVFRGFLNRTAIEPGAAPSGVESGAAPSIVGSGGGWVTPTMIGKGR